MDEFTDALVAYNDALAAWIIAATGPLPVDEAEWEARADAARSALIAAHEAAVEAARRDALPIPPAMSVAEAEALADDLIDCAAPYDDRAGWRDKDFAALDGARAAIIAALTGRATDAALADVDRLLDAINWALGCGDAFPDGTEGKGAFYWREELARRSGLRYDPEEGRYVLRAAAAALTGQGGVA